MLESKQQGALWGLTAALLFGISPPLAKLLLPESGPLLTAGLLYLGAGLGLLFIELTSRRWLSLHVKETPIRLADIGLLAGVILTGGMLGPFLMLWGLERLSGVLTSLLLNLEAPFTVLVAIVLFREHLDSLELTGVVLIAFAAGILAYRPGAIGGEIFGILAVLGACFCWAIDNNLSQQLSLRDPMTVTCIKTLSAGLGMLALAAASTSRWPSGAIILATFLLGLISYGLSLVLDMYALRLLGAAREAGFFATAPFIGAVAAMPILGERWDIQDTTATILMMIGVVLLLRARHTHVHAHEELEHEHLHLHDAHHNHFHDGEALDGEPHAHVHHHPAFTHDHQHVSELHHRHEH